MKSARLKRAALVTSVIATLGTTAAPSALATPPIGEIAAAPVSFGGCTVKPLKPEFAGHTADGLKKATFPVAVTCLPGTKSIQILHQGYDDDSNETSQSDRVFDRLHDKHYFRPDGGSRTFETTIPVRPWDGANDPYVELVHYVRFEVCSGNLCQWFPPAPDYLWLFSPVSKFLV